MQKYFSQDIWARLFYYSPTMARFLKARMWLQKDVVFLRLRRKSTRKTLKKINAK